VRSPLSVHGIQQCRLIILFGVAIFHASFHPTRGNVLDWSLKAADGIPSHYTIASKYAKPYASHCLDVQLDGVEFSALPSGLHLLEHDVV
jgi:hypothetical protein